jgi:hypothetical protein
MMTGLCFFRKEAEEMITNIGIERAEYLGRLEEMG